MNPFKHGCAVEGEFFCPRAELERQLRSFAESGQNVVVHGERRMGKTSLIRHAIGGMKKMRMVYVDLYCIQTLSDFCRRVMNGIAEANESMSFIKKAMSFVNQLRPTLSFDVNTGAPQISVDARAANAPDSLGAVMGMIRHVARDDRICVVFDEFQDILDIDRTDVVLAEMRSTIQFQPDTPYFFSGSVRNDMLRIFDDSRSPFFKSAATFTVGSIESSEFERFIAARFRRGDRKVDAQTVRTLIEYADSVTGDVQELCGAIWDTTESGSEVTAKDIPRALDCVFAREGESFGESVRQMTPLQVSVLRAFSALDTSRIFSEEFMQRVGTTSTGALRTAINRLVARRIIYEFGGKYRFTNPFFKAWLVERM